MVIHMSCSKVEVTSTLPDACKSASQVVGMALVGCLDMAATPRQPPDVWEWALTAARYPVTRYWNGDLVTLKPLRKDETVFVDKWVSVIARRSQWCKYWLIT